MSYVDGFVIPVSKKKIAEYQRIAKAASKVWRSHGAIQYFECVIEDTNMKFGLPFPKLAKCKPGETIVFSWITYKSRAQRDKVNAKVMKDPRILKMMKEMENKPLFDMKRMTYGGFDVIVKA